MSLLSRIARQGLGFGKLVKQTPRINSSTAEAQHDVEALEKLSLRDDKNKRISSEQFLQRLKEVVGKDPAGDEDFAVPRKALDLVVAEYDALLTEVDDLKDKYKRALAETENVRGRGQKQTEAAKIFAVQSFCKDLLEVADVLDLAINAVKPEVIAANSDIKNLHDGVVMMKTVLHKTFEKHGLTQISPEGEKFDPNLHEAVFQVPKGQTQHQPGHVGVVMKLGYSLHGRPIRPAQVGVVQG
uniref:GrpE protein homolog n=1 Tax=Panagrellus redivivus TaxID=6233 RepID=A0A7E4V178_PANRE